MPDQMSWRSFKEHQGYLFYCTISTPSVSVTEQVWSGGILRKKISLLYSMQLVLVNSQ